jgi:hypothetical protein
VKTHVLDRGKRTHSFHETCLRQGTVRVTARLTFRLREALPELLVVWEAGAQLSKGGC